MMDLSNDTTKYPEIFAQGADVVAVSEGNIAGLWWEDTPDHEGGKVGAIGACELTVRAEGFLRSCVNYLHLEQGCAHVIGPMNGNTWRQYRLTTETSDLGAFLMEPLEPMHYRDSFAKAGFDVLAGYSSSLVDLNKEVRSFDVLEDKLTELGVKIRPISLENFDRDLTAIYHLSLESFKDNFLYTDINEASFVSAYREKKDLLEPEFILMAECDSELLGYVFAVPDLLALKRGESAALIVKTLATSPRFRLAGLGSVLVDRVHKAAVRKGYASAIHALQFESNSSLRISGRFGAEVFRRYALMICSKK